MPRVIVTSSNKEVVDFICQSLGVAHFTPAPNNGGLLALGVMITKLQDREKLVVCTDPSGASLISQLKDALPQVTFKVMTPKLTRSRGEEERTLHQAPEVYPKLQGPGVICASRGKEEMEFLSENLKVPYYDCSGQTGAILLYPELERASRNGEVLLVHAKPEVQEQVKSVLANTWVPFAFAQYHYAATRVSVDNFPPVMPLDRSIADLRRGDSDRVYGIPGPAKVTVEDATYLLGGLSLEDVLQRFKQ